MRVRFEEDGVEIDTVSGVLPGGRGFKIDMGPTPDWGLLDTRGPFTVLEGPYEGVVFRGRDVWGTTETVWLSGPWPESIPDRPRRPMFGITPVIEDDDLLPQFIAVCVPGDGTAGYVDADVFEDGDDLTPTTPEEWIAYSETVKGEIHEVFDTRAAVVGYFATTHGFVDEARKDQLLTEGFRLLRGRTPTPQGSDAIEH
jgi:hypothetical protein